MIPAYKRPEYTKKCILSICEAQNYDNTDFYMVDDGSKDGTSQIFEASGLPGYIVEHDENIGLRAAVIDFFDFAKTRDYDILGKMDSDCKVPPNWLRDILYVFENDRSVDVLSPNVLPSDAARKLGRSQPGKLFWDAPYVGGLWFMKSSLIEGIDFEDVDVRGIKGAFNLFDQINTEKEPVVGWLPDVEVQDMGHWSGLHPEHIKTGEHVMYYNEVGRKTQW